MYDWLPQADTPKVVKWVLSYVSKSFEETKLLFSPNVQSSLDLKSHMSLMKLLISLLKTFLMCVNLKSRTPVSYSMIVCIYYKHQFRCSIHDHLAFMFFFKHCDDRSGVVVHRSSDFLLNLLLYHF